MKFHYGSRLPILLVLSPCFLNAQIKDDFNDGNDQGWSRLEPIKPFGAVTTFSFPGTNTYRLQAGPSPAPATVGQARIGAHRAEASFSSFRISVDLVNRDPSLEQDIGILARVTSPGLGTLNAYAATLDTDEGQFYFSKITNEGAGSTQSIEAPLTPSGDYRLVFHGFQNQFLIEVFDPQDPATPIASLKATDEEFGAPYLEGTCGIFVSSGTAEGSCDATFDDFEASSASDIDQDGLADDEEMRAFGNLDQNGEDDSDHDGQSNAFEILAGTDPFQSASSFKITQITHGHEIIDERSVNTTSLSFPVSSERSYSLQSSDNLQDWTELPSAVFSDHGDGVGSFKFQRESKSQYLRVSVVR